MPEYTLLADIGRGLGSRNSRRLRREDKIPAVMYGHGSDPVSLIVDRPLFRTTLNAAGRNAVITLDVGGEKHLTIVKEMQRDAIANRVTHVDFLLIRADEKLTVEVSIVTIGEAVEAEREGSVVQQQLLALAIEATAGDIPAQIVVDITDLTIDNPVRVSDLVLGAGVTVLEAPNTLVVIGQRSRASLAEEGGATAEDAEELVEGEDGPDSEAAGDTESD
jgi:large subunit ribosomal protein L25